MKMEGENLVEAKQEKKEKTVKELKAEADISSLEKELEKIKRSVKTDVEEIEGTVEDEVTKLQL